MGILPDDAAVCADMHVACRWTDSKAGYLQDQQVVGMYGIRDSEVGRYHTSHPLHQEEVTDGWLWDAAVQSRISPGLVRGRLDISRVPVDYLLTYGTIPSPSCWVAVGHGCSATLWASRCRLPNHPHV